MVRDRRGHRISEIWDGLRSVALLLAALALLIASPYGTGTSQAAPRKGGRVVIGVSQEITTLNPLSPNNDVDRDIEYSIFEALWRIAPTGRFLPNLAAEIPTMQNGGISPDGLTYTFRLKRGVRWQDGQPFTSRDVQFTWQTIMNPRFRTQSRVGYDSIADITTLDADTAVVKMKQRFAPFLVVWSDTYIVPEHLLGQVSDLNTASFNTHPVGTGPFAFGEWKSGEYVLLKANPLYRGPGPYLDEIVFKLVPDLNQLYTQFKAGEIDVVDLKGIPNNYYQQAKTLPNRRIFTSRRMATEQLLINFISQHAPFLAELPIRQALYLAMDKGPIINGVRFGVDTPADTYLPPYSWAFSPKVPRHTYDPEKAKAMLEAAGWKIGSGGIRVKNGMRLQFDLATNTGDPLRAQAEQILQQQWRAVGIDARINNMAAATVFGDYERLSKFDIMLLQVILGPDPDYSNRLDSHNIPAKNGTHSGQNFGAYSNARMDELLEAGELELDQVKRKAIYAQVQALVATDLPMLPLFHPAVITGAKATLRGFVPNPYLQGDSWNTGEWYWEP